MQKIVSQFYSFKKDVYLVLGKFNHCIYDLKNGDLYRINNETKNFIVTVIANGIETGTLLEQQQRMLNTFIDNNLIIPSKQRSTLQDIKTLRTDYPFTFAWIEVTRKCNHKCSFCYEKSSSACSEEMDFEDFSHLIKEIKKNGIKNIQFIGGEPLLLGDKLKSMIDLCGKDFSFIEVFTNGSLIDDKWCGYFKKKNIAVAMTIHSYLSEEHDKITKINGSHKKVMQAVELVKKHELKYRLATIKTSQCRIGDMPNDCICKLCPSNVRLTGRGNITQYNLDMFKEKAIKKETMTNQINKGFIIKNVSGHQCFLNKLYISSNLDVYPCVMERRFKHGNLKDNELTNILDKKIRTLSKDEIEVCKDCEYRYACFDCRPDSNGDDKFAKPWYCTYDPYTGKWLEVEKVFKKLN